MARRWYHPAVLDDLDGTRRIGEILATNTGPIGAVTGTGAGGIYGRMGGQDVTLIDHGAAIGRILNAIITRYCQCRAAGNEYRSVVRYQLTAAYRGAAGEDFDRIIWGIVILVLDGTAVDRKFTFARDGRIRRAGDLAGAGDRESGT